MKSNIKGRTGGKPAGLDQLRQEILATAERLVNERQDEILEATQTSVMQQVLAVTFWILHREHGWGKERLNRLKNHIEDEFVLMHKQPMGKEYSPLDVRTWLKEYGVDLEETQYKGGVD